MRSEHKDKVEAKLESWKGGGEEILLAVVV